MNKDITFINPEYLGFDTDNREWIRVRSADDNDQHYSLDEYDVLVTLKAKKLPAPRELWVRNDKRSSDPSHMGYKEPEGLEPGDAVFVNALGYTTYNAKGVFYSNWETSGVEPEFKVIPYFLYWFDFDVVAYDD